MPISLYMDEHIPRSITVGLRLRGIDVISAYEDGVSGMSDNDLLDRADELKRVIFTQDDDFLVEAARRQKEGIPFRGIIMHISSVFQSGNVLTVLKSLQKQVNLKICLIRCSFCPSEL